MMEIINLSRDGEQPILGDLVKIIHDNGMTEVKLWGDDSVQANPKSTILSKFEFLSLFTPDEYAAMLGVLPTNAYAQYFWALFNSAVEIDMANPSTRQGLELFVSLGILSQEKFDTIFNVE